MLRGKPMQDIQTLKSEIISALDFLSPDNLKLLAKFVAFLRTNTAQTETDQLNLEQDVEFSPKLAHITSPRLVHREQAADFKKEVVEIVADDSL